MYVIFSCNGPVSCSRSLISLVSCGDQNCLRRRRDRVEEPHESYLAPCIIIVHFVILLTYTSIRLVQSSELEQSEQSEQSFSNGRCNVYGLCGTWTVDKCQLTRSFLGVEALQGYKNQRWLLKSSSECPARYCPDITADFPNNSSDIA